VNAVFLEWRSEPVSIARWGHFAITLQRATVAQEKHCTWLEHRQIDRRARTFVSSKHQALSAVHRDP
jgi:hypothetical protein